MTMADMYAEMKEALTFFGLRFYQMDQVSFMAYDGYVVFFHGGRSISVNT